VLFGSVAKGEQGVGSDVDILIIAESLPSNFLERSRLLFELNQSFAPIEPVGYTPKEFLLMLERRHPTALYAVADGLVLRDDGFMKEAKRVFELVKKKFGLVRVKHGWEARSLAPVSKPRV
jgi:predicted nucleotidyltransferase